MLLQLEFEDAAEFIAALASMCRRTVGGMDIHEGEHPAHGRVSVVIDGVTGGGAVFRGA